MTMQKGICEECKKEYDYEYNPKYPRKYCPECSAKKKVEYEGKMSGEVPEVKHGLVQVSGPGMPSNKNATMYVSYAKDIFCSLGYQGTDINEMLNLMSHSIKLVKQARGEFE